MVMRNRAAQSAGYIVVEHRTHPPLLQNLKLSRAIRQWNRESDFNAAINV
jgi:hypothetical protein